MEAVETQLVWYAAYGSNMARSRFLAYLGGSRVPGAEGGHAGARDGSEPLADEPCRFDRSIRFTGHSKRWLGAPAVLDHAATSPGALGRRYLVTRQQFEDVVAQENRRPARRIPIESLTVGAVTATGRSSYAGLLLLGFDGSIPVMTFTSPRRPEKATLAAPSGAYLATIARGITESHPLTASEVAEYLLAAPGVAPTWTADRIEALLE